MKRLITTSVASSSPQRPGATVVEFALVVPLVLFLVFAAVEFARLNMLVNSMQNAAYEGARRGIVPGASVDRIEQAALAVLEGVGAVDSRVIVSPAVISSSTPQVQVTVRVPLDENAWVAPRFVQDVVLERSCTLSRERPGR
jgi:Flp pilus assembly protein TadG